MKINNIKKAHGTYIFPLPVATICRSDFYPKTCFYVQKLPKIPPVPIRKPERVCTSYMAKLPCLSGCWCMEQKWVLGKIWKQNCLWLSYQNIRKFSIFPDKTRGERWGWGERGPFFATWMCCARYVPIVCVGSIIVVLFCVD